MKRALYWVIPILLIFFILILPRLASTSLGKPFLTRAIEARLGAQVTLGKVSLSWFGPQTFEKITISSPDVDAAIDSLESDVPIWALSDLGSTFRLQNGAFSFPNYGGGQIVHVNAQLEQGDIEATGATTQGGHLSLKGNIDSKEDYDLVFDLKSVPTFALDQLLKAKGLLYQILGPTLNLTGAMAYNRGEGTLSCDLSSTQVQTTLNAALTESSLTLKEPLLATFQLTADLGSSLIRNVNPLFLTGVEGKKPIILRVATQNFLLPLHPFDLAQLRIGSATLDLGQVRARAGQSLQSLLQLLKSPRSGENISIWFTPIAFQLEDGLLQTGRMDALLADSIHVCTWGNIDLIRDRLDLFLGLPADTLAQSFGLRNLPRHYVLKIPIRGTIQDPDIDTKAASSKIAAMVAAQEIPKIGGTGGKVFGGLLNLFAQPKEDEDVPPPNRPFPWER